MIVPAGWSASEVLASFPIRPWEGRAWRFHKQKYVATDPGGSLKVSGRYNLGLDLAPADTAWPALYLSLGPEICLGEVVRHTQLVAQLNGYRLTELSVGLMAVLDLAEPRSIGLTLDDVCHDTDYAVTQEIAAAAINRGAEAILVPSATRLGTNLILFPHKLGAASSIAIVASRDPLLYVARR